MNLLDAIADKIQNANVGYDASSIFVNFIPPEKADAVMLRDYFGGVNVNHETPGYFKTQFQMIVRSTDQAAGVAAAQAISDVLNSTKDPIGSVNIPGLAEVKYVRPKIKPMTFPVSAASGNWETLVNFEIAYVE